MDKFSWTTGILLGALVGATIYLLYLMSADQSSIYEDYDTLQLQQGMDERQEDLRINP